MSSIAKSQPITSRQNCSSYFLNNKTLLPNSISEENEVTAYCYELSKVIVGNDVNIDFYELLKDIMFQIHYNKSNGILFVLKLN